MRRAPLTILDHDLGPDELQLANIRRLAKRGATPKPAPSPAALESAVADLKIRLTTARQELQHKNEIIASLRQEIAALREAQMRHAQTVVATTIIPIGTIPA